jgi:hypothetical protein
MDKDLVALTMEVAGQVFLEVRDSGSFGELEMYIFSSILMHPRDFELSEGLGWTGGVEASILFTRKEWQLSSGERNM